MLKVHAIILSYIKVLQKKAFVVAIMVNLFNLLKLLHQILFW